MPIIALDSENEHVHDMVDKLKEIFKLKDIKYTEKRGQIVVTIPRKLSPDEQKDLDEAGEGKSHNKSEPEKARGKPKESNTQDGGAGNTTQGQLAAAPKPKPPHDGKK